MEGLREKQEFYYETRRLLIGQNFRFLNDKQEEGMVFIMFYLLFAVVFSAIIAIFAVQNAGVVTISFLTWKMESSLAVIVVAAAGIGILIALSIEMMIQVRLRLRLRQSNSRIKELEAQVGKYITDAAKSVKETAKETASPAPLAPPLPPLEKSASSMEAKEGKPFIK